MAKIKECECCEKEFYSKQHFEKLNVNIEDY